MKERINSCKDLRVFQNALTSAMRVFESTEKMTSQPDKGLIKPSPGQEMKNGGPGLGRPFQDKQRVPSAA